MMFLPPDKWSPRFGEQFYTVKMAKFLKCQTPPTTDSFASDTCSCFSSPVGPAVYYEVMILSGNSSQCVYRRYSEFHYLWKKTGGFGLVLPPKTSLFHEDTDEFLNGRLEELYLFLTKALAFRECSGNAMVERFLGLGE